MEDKVLLDVQGLKTYFHTFKGVVKAVDNVSFSLKEGEILGIVGESGSGKSVTSFSILKLVEDPGVVDADHIMFDGKDLAKISEKDMSKIRGKDISMVFQDPMTSLNPLYTIQRQMEEVLILHEPQMNKAQRRERCIELLHAVGIPNPEERLKEYPNQFSGGMRQRCNSCPAHTALLILTDILNLLRSIRYIRSQTWLNNFICNKGSDNGDQECRCYHEIPVTYRKYIVAWIDHLSCLCGHTSKHGVIGSDQKVCTPSAGYTCKGCCKTCDWMTAECHK